MDMSIYHAAAALNATTRWQEMIAQNIAASAVPGFKQQELSFAGIQAGQLSVAGSGLPATPVILPSLTEHTSMSQGELRYTGVPTNVALEGQGFFEVQLPNGDNAYTRDGEFHVDAQGQLVTKQGYPVLGGGRPIQLDPNNPAPVSISSDGEVSQGADSKGRITVTDFNDPQRLRVAGNGLYLAQDPNLHAIPATDARLHQGYTEAGNISPVVAMGEMIDAMRHFEANQRVLQIQDERLGRVIGDLGNTSPN